MYRADTHMHYHRERHGDLVRATSRRDVARELSVARDRERRSFLARTWERRFGGRTVAAPAPPVTA